MKTPTPKGRKAGEATPAVMGSKPGKHGKPVLNDSSSQSAGYPPLPEVHRGHTNLQVFQGRIKKPGKG